jgi:peptidoglycan-associated lipoprotein
MTRKSGFSLGFSTMVLGACLALFSGCPPTYPKCESDDHCKEKGEVCVQGMCQECATDANCKAGFACDGNKCVPPKAECTPSDDKCGDGKKCNAKGKCEVAPPQCTKSEDCGTGQECNAKGKCVTATVVTPPPECTFEAVRFGFNEYTLAPDVQTALGKAAECIKKGKLLFTLEGHADERGTDEYNMQLSQKRAASVRKYLVDLGVAGGALDTVGYGEAKPARQGTGEDVWAANRRVEFKKR